MTDTHGIHHWMVIWSSYRKLAWIGFEPTTTEFCSDAVTDWAIKPWVQLTLRANFIQLLQFHRLFSVRFHFGYCLRQSPCLFQLKFSWGNHVSVAEVRRGKLKFSWGNHVSEYIFNCYLAVPRPTLGHSQVDSLLTQCLSLHLYIFHPKVTGSLIA